MTQSTKQYWTMLRTMSRAMSTRFGVDLRMAGVETRAALAVTGAANAMLLKLLVDKGIITDAEIQAAYLDAKNNNVWDQEPVDPDPNGS